jgi:antitoxin ParD1/3/4
MAKNTSILLGEHFEEYISNKVASGKYSSASEVVRTALRLMETEEEKLARLKKALMAGEKSGFVKNFNPEENLKRLRKKFL